MNQNQIRLKSDPGLVQYFLWENAHRKQFSSFWWNSRVDPVSSLSRRLDMIVPLKTMWRMWILCCRCCYWWAFSCTHNTECMRSRFAFAFYTSVHPLSCLLSLCGARNKPSTGHQSSHQSRHRENVQTPHRKFLTFLLPSAYKLE